MQKVYFRLTCVSQKQKEASAEEEVLTSMNLLGESFSEVCTLFESKTCYYFQTNISLRASSPIWASEANRARTRERAGKPRGAVASPLACLSRVYFSRYPPNGELARRLDQYLICANVQFELI